jgi:hypothetical protein
MPAEALACLSGRQAKAGKPAEHAKEKRPHGCTAPYGLKVLLATRWGSANALLVLVVYMHSHVLIEVLQILSWYGLESLRIWTFGVILPEISGIARENGCGSLDATLVVDASISINLKNRCCRKQRFAPPASFPISLPQRT